jgi:hypothetical protein
MLDRFSPFVISDRGYYRQAALYRRGARILGRPTQFFYHLVVESTPPYDVGAFALDPEAMEIGDGEIDSFIATLDSCEANDHWPGMFPGIQRGTVTDAIIRQLEEAA